MRQECAEIARGLRKHDPDLLDRLIERYHYRLLRYLISLTGDRVLAEDAFQETWLHVLERGSQYNGRASFESWLFSIARHLVIDWSRKKKGVSLEALTEPDDGRAPLQVPAGQPSPLELVAEREEAERLARALPSLPAVYREVLVLRFQEEMKLEEIAAVAGVTLSTAKSRLYRGLEALRRAIEGGRA